MTNTYRVEAHDGSRWAFGIRINPNTHLPEFCGMQAAATGDRESMEGLLQDANRTCGGTLRLAAASADD